MAHESLLWRLWRAMYRRYDSNPIFGVLHSGVVKNVSMFVKPGFFAAFATARTLERIHDQENYSVLAVTPISQLELTWLASVGAAFFEKNPTMLFFTFFSASPILCGVVLLSTPVFGISLIFLLPVLVVFDNVLGVLSGMFIFAARRDGNSDPIMALILHSVIYIAGILGVVTVSAVLWLNQIGTPVFCLFPLTNVLLFAMYAEITTHIMWNMIVRRYDALPIEAQNILSGDL